jgi:choice-of-anchor C domain-containing protein
MITHRLLPHLALGLLLASQTRIPGSQLPRDADKRIQEFEAEAAASQKKADAEIQVLRGRLLAALQSLQDASSKAGKLDEALAIRGRIRQLTEATEYNQTTPRAATTKKGFAAFLDHEGRRLAVWTRDGALRFFNLVDVQQGGRQFRHRVDVLQLELPGARLFTCAFVPEGKSLAVVAGTRGEIYLWDFLAEGKAPPDTLRRAEQEEKGASEAGKNKYLCFAVSPDGKTLAGGLARSGESKRRLLLWEAARGKPLHQLRSLRQFASQEPGVCWVTFTADGKGLVSGSEDGTFCLWDVASGKEVSRFTGASLSPKRHLPIALAPDGHALAQALPNHTIQLWDVIAGKKLHLLRGHSAEIRALSYFLAEGKLLVSASKAGEMFYWDRASGHKIGQREVTDPETIVSSANGRITVWNANDHHISFGDNEARYATGSDLPEMPRPRVVRAPAVSETMISEDQLPDDAIKRLQEFEAEAIRKKAGSAIGALQRKLLEDLQLLQDAHTKAGELDEAVAIRDVIGQLKAAWEKARNLVVNGSFEEGPTLRFDFVHSINLEKGSTAVHGWVVTGGHVAIVDPTYWQPADGQRSLAIGGGEGTAAGGIRQDFATRKGQKYRVTFWMAGDTNGGPSEKKLRVSAAGKSAEFVFDTTGKDRKEMGWVKQSWEFTSEADRTTVEFASLTEGMYGPALDKVSVVEVNE